MDAFGGWRELFYVYGTAGLLILIPWLIVAQDDPAGQKALTGSSSSLVGVLSMLREAPWTNMVQSKAAWAMLLAHCARNWGLYNSLAWTPTFYAEQYGIGVKDSAWLLVLPSIAGAVGGFVAGNAADSWVRNMQDATDDKEKTKIRNTFQAVGLFGPAIALGTLASNIPEQAWVAQSFLAVAFGLQSFNSGGYEAAFQEKAGPRWSGLLYSVTSLPAVLVGTGGVYVTGLLLDATGQDWGVVFGINALINAFGAVAFIALYDSKKEFD
jgi:ACS family sodium-dependent inorganic phosphate cotransporter